nr:putative late blight resistance protein homolog R1A-10 [Coffea arabica]
MPVFQVPVKDHILKLHQGIRYLSTLLKQEEKLDDEMKDLLGLAVRDAGILIFSLSVNEIKESLPRETYLRLFHLHKVLKYMMADLAHNYLVTSPYSSFNYRRSNELGCMDFFLEDLQELASVMRLMIQMLSDWIESNWSTKISLKPWRSIMVKPRELTRIPFSYRHKLAVAVHNEDLVGLDDKVKTIIDRLTRGLKQLDVVPIVASTVFVQLLCSIHSKSPNEYLKMDENDLVQKLKQVLLRTRYLLILDDLWDVEAWNLLENSLPNDVNGSRILFTSRFQDLSLQFKPGSKPYHLCQLTDEESWVLLQKKLFDKEGCPPKLSEVGYQIAKFCRGLPLTVVLVAGILATIAQDSWEEVAKSLSSIVLHDEYCMKTLELSYSHLPDYLKSCLLYFAAFQEDEVIDVRRLLWLWISEGFVQQTEGKSLEEAAYNYLMGLINRSLVVANKKGAMNGAKTCQLHDLVHEFCVKKAKEECFLHIIHSWKDPFGLTGPSNPHRVCVHDTRKLKIWELMLLFPNLRCLLLPENDILLPQEEDWGILLPKLLRVLDLGGLIIGKSFPMEVVLLVHLRYLVLSGIRSIPSAIDNLSSIPDLDHLETLSLAIDPSAQCLQRILKKLPSIRWLKCWRSSGLQACARNRDKILVFNCLKLESLHLENFRNYRFEFPLNLKKLVLEGNRQPWSEISTIGKLPHLEVLKLLDYSFIGEEWEMKEGEFPSLRVLKLSDLDIRRWTASSGNFSHLEKLVVDNCDELEEVPSCLGECPTLETIEVTDCPESVVNSVNQIRQEQLIWEMRF